MDPDDTSRPSRGTVHVTPETDPALLPVPVEAPILPIQRGFRWGAVFWTAIAGLVLLGTGLGIAHLIEDLFARSPRIAPDPKHSVDEDRLIAVGVTGKGRPVFVAFTLRTINKRRLIRPVTARYMHAKEIAAYEKEISTPENR